jgi:hypothetical protein
MIHLTGFYYCTNSCWDGKTYDSRNMVVIEMYPDNLSDDDFNNTVKQKMYLNQKYYEDLLTRDHLKDEPKLARIHATRLTRVLEDKVLKWLNDNVADNTKENEKGWACGSSEYNKEGGSDFALWFYRRRDAVKFIKTWSKYGKATQTYNQNTYIEKNLNVDTMKYEIKER